MNRTPDRSNSDLTSDRGTASARREPAGLEDGREAENRLHEVDATDRGASLDDHQRDRGSNGLRDGYDDSITRRKGDGEGEDRLGVARGD